MSDLALGTPAAGVFRLPCLLLLDSSGKHVLGGWGTTLLKPKCQSVRRQGREKSFGEPNARHSGRCQRLTVLEKWTPGAKARGLGSLFVQLTIILVCKHSHHSKNIEYTLCPWGAQPGLREGRSGLSLTETSGGFLKHCQPLGTGLALAGQAGWRGGASALDSGRGDCGWGWGRQGRESRLRICSSAGCTVSCENRTDSVSRGKHLSVLFSVVRAKEKRRVIRDKRQLGPSRGGSA